MSKIGQDTLKTRRSLNVGSKNYDYYSLKAASDGRFKKLCPVLHEICQRSVAKLKQL